MTTLSARLLFVAVLAAQTPSATRQQAEAMRSLTDADLAQGKYNQALEHAGNCASQFQQLGDVDQQVRCAILSGEAQVYLGQYAEAAQALREAAGVARAKGLTARWATALNDLANVRFYTGNYTDAYRLYQDAAGIVDRDKSNPRIERVRQLTQANLAALYQRLGQYERALEIYRGLESSDALSPAQHAEMLSNIGALYRRLGDPYKAIDQYRKAAELFAKGQDRNGEIGMLTNTGVAMAMDLEEYSIAIQSFEQALRLALSSRNLREAAVAHLDLSETLRRLGRLGEAQVQAQDALKIADELVVGEEQWTAWYTLGRIEEDRSVRPAALADYRRAIEIFETLRSGLSATDLRSGYLGDKRGVYDGAVRMLLAESPLNAEELFHDLEQVRARTLKDRLGSGSAASLSEVAMRLASDSALLEYWTDGKEAAVVWIARERSGVRKLAVVQDAGVEEFLDQLRGGSAEWKERSRDLASKLLPVLADLPPTVRRLVIVADGKLASIPFEALAQGNGLLQDNYTVSYLPAASMLRVASGAREWLWPWRRVFAGFADPVIPIPGEDGTLFATSLAPLAGARQEIDDIARLLGGRSELHTGQDNLRRYVDSARLHGIPVLHFATHGIADAEDPERSRLVFSSSAPGQPFDLLFAREVYDVDLTGAKLVTLAACDTETGRSIPGEGVAALSRAFLSAGAQSTVSTLWRIGDRSSEELMRSFYRELGTGKTVADALRTAKVEAARSAHPRDWAAFVLNGDAGATVPRRIPLLAAPTLLLLLAALLWYWWRPQKGAGTKGATAPLDVSATKPTN